MRATSPARQGPSLWIQRPWVDLAIGCGGWSAPLLAFAYLRIDAQAERWAALFYLLALVCNYPHYMATIHRAYARTEDRAAYRLFTHYITAGIAAAAIAAHAWPVLIPWLFTAYVMWSPWHYAGQNFGLSMMFLRRGGIEVSSRERQALYGAFVASYVLLLAAFNEGAPRDRMVLSLGLSAPLAWAIQAMAAAVFVAGLVFAFGNLRRRVPLRRLVPALTLASTQALWFVVPVLMARFSSLPSPALRYSTGVLAVMHSAQYLWITQHYARRDAECRGAPAAWNARAYWGVLVLGGAALFVPAPWLASVIGHVDFTASALIVAAAVNIHHFVLDGVVWKLRDPKVAQALLPADAASAPGTVAAWRPARTQARGRRRLVLAAATLMLVALALVDQVRYALSGRDGDIEALQTARLLNAHDSRIHLKLAAAERQRGADAAAERSLRDAVAANPRDVAPLWTLLRFLLDAERFSDAYPVNTALLAVAPRDVDALVNAGVLAQRLGDTRMAAEWWEKALDENDRLGEVHLYLAELLDATDRANDAVPHYQRYLELVSDAHPEKPDARKVSLVLIKFADALSRTGKRDLATSQYQLATRIARASALRDVEKLAIERGGLASAQ